MNTVFVVKWTRLHPWAYDTKWTECSSSSFNLMVMKRNIFIQYRILLRNETFAKEKEYGTGNPGGICHASYARHSYSLQLTLSLWYHDTNDTRVGLIFQPPLNSRELIDISGKQKFTINYQLSKKCHQITESTISLRRMMIKKPLETSNEWMKQYWYQ